METKRILSPILLIGLFSAFAIVCLIVYLQRGKREKWISRKMKLGAAIITITGITTGCPPIATCYVPAYTDGFVFDQSDSSENYWIVADLPNDSILTGVVHSPTSDGYTFKINTFDSITVQEGDFVALDGDFDESVDSFRMQLDTKLEDGVYDLQINSADMPDEYLIERRELKIK